MDDSRSAMIRARTTKTQDSESVVENAMNLEFLTRTHSALCIHKKKRSLNDAPSVKVRKLRLLSVLSATGL